MYKLIVALILAVSLFGCKQKAHVVIATTPPSASEIVRQSLVRITRDFPDGRGSICTGFAIAPRKFMTAAHCVGTLKMQTWIGTIIMEPSGHHVDGVVATPVSVDEKNDLAIVLADIVKPAIAFREGPPNWLEMVYGMGYGQGMTKPIVTEHRVQAVKYLDKDMLEYDLVAMTVYIHPFIGGMSGGPVYDEEGRVVGIIQMSSSYIGYGVDNDVLKKFLEQKEALDPTKPHEVKENESIWHLILEQ